MVEKYNAVIRKKKLDHKKHGTSEFVPKVVRTEREDLVAARRKPSLPRLKFLEQKDDD